MKITKSANDYICEILENKKMTVSDLADAFGKSRQSMWQELHGRKDLAFEAYRKYLDFLGYDVYVEGKPVPLEEKDADVLTRVMQNNNVKNVDIAAALGITKQGAGHVLKCKRIKTNTVERILNLAGEEIDIRARE